VCTCACAIPFPYDNDGPLEIDMAQAMPDWIDHGIACVALRPKLGTKRAGDLSTWPRDSTAHRTIGYAFLARSRFTTRVSMGFGYV
jgi:hypothetical protein